VFFTEFPIPTPDSEPSGIVTGSDGNLWFTEGEGNKIGRITTTGGPTDYIGRMTTAGALAEFPIPTLEAAPLGITTGPNGNLWFVESGGGRSGA
jgi:virginiamycin B lyase